MKTKERVALVSGKHCQDLVCPSCGGDRFHVGVEVSDFSIGVHCDCGYGITFNYRPGCQVLETSGRLGHSTKQTMP